MAIPLLANQDLTPMLYAISALQPTHINYHSSSTQRLKKGGTFNNGKTMTRGKLSETTKHQR